MGFLHLVLLIGGGLLLSWISWISVQSLLQARLLYRLRRLSSLAPDEFGRQACYGRVEITRPLRLAFGDVLWCRTEHQVYRRRGKSSGWRTESTDEQAAGFTLEGRVLAELPTEVQGTASRTDTHDRSGWFGGHGNGDRRTVYTYLPPPAFATLVGRLGERGFERDNKLGLLLSPHEPGHAATIELWKGIGGLVLVTAALIIGLVIFYGQV